MLYKFAIHEVAKVPSVGKVMQQTIFIVTNVSAVAIENPASVGSVMQYFLLHNTLQKNIRWDGYVTFTV